MTKFSLAPLFLAYFLFYFNSYKLGTKFEQKYCAIAIGKIQIMWLKSLKGP